jgi:plastocyanin
MNGKVVVAAGSGATGGGSTGGGGGATVQPSTVTAQGLQFDTKTLTIPANTPSSLTFDNKDAGTPHNIAIYASASDLSNPLFRGDVVTGPATKTYDIPALKPGTYYFHCDVHPTMNGSVTVQ